MNALPLKFIFILCMLVASAARAQSEEERFIARFRKMDVAPEGLLSNRSAVIHSAAVTDKELEKIQKAFQQTGIDAVEYLNSDRVLAGKDLLGFYSTHFTRRGVKFLIFAAKQSGEYQLWFLPFNPRTIWSKPEQPAWLAHSANLQDLLVAVFRTLVSTQKRENFLINDLPEREDFPTIFSNTRNESLIPNLKAFKVAVPYLTDRSADNELTQYFKDNFHGKYEIVSDTITEKDLVQKGFRYVLRFIHAPGILAKEMLGYDMSKSESALASVTYPNGNLQLKTIPSNTAIYKFYFKDLEDKNLYFGLKWDSDVTWLDALKNHIDAYRASGRIN